MPPPATPIKAKSPATAKQQLNAKNLTKGTPGGAQQPGKVLDRVLKWQNAVVAGEPEVGIADVDDTNKPDDGNDDGGTVAVETSAVVSPDVGGVVSPAPAGEVIVSVETILPEIVPWPAEDGPPATNDENKPTPATPTKAKPVGNQHASVRTAPKKRVLSDGHWRKVKSPPKSPGKDAIPNTDGANESKEEGKKPAQAKTQLVWVRPAARPRTRVQPRPAEAARQASSDNSVEQTQESRPRRPSEEIKASGSGKRRNRRLSGGVQPTKANGMSKSDGTGEAAGSVEGGKNDASPPSSPSPPAKRRSKRRETRTSPEPLENFSAEFKPQKPTTPMANERPRQRTSSRRIYGSNEELVERQTSPVVEDEPPKQRQQRTKKGERVEETIERLFTPEKSPNPQRPLDEVKVPRRYTPRKSAEKPLEPPPEEDPKEPFSKERRSRRRRPSHQEHKEEYVPDNLPTPFPATPKVFGSRVEAWLTTTPDPFVDDPEPKRRHSRSLASKTPRDGWVSDTSLPPIPRDDESAELKRREGRHGSRRRRRSPDPKIHVDYSERDRDQLPSQARRREASTPLPEKHKESTPLSSGPTLKRSGARRNSHSPTKGRTRSLPYREVPREQDDASSGASSVDASAIALPPSRKVSRRAMPSTGFRLSTIASVETFHTKVQVAPPSRALTSGRRRDASGAENVPPSEVSFTHERATLPLKRGSTKRRMAKHDDLMSVLSMSKPEDGKSIVSARSIRTNRSRLATATITDLMSELASDEIRYMRELHTLVDGVVPVLMSCVMSKSDAVVAAGLFNRSAGQNDPNATRPIFDMGVALERLKATHKRLPLKDPEALLTWGTNAHRIYSDYIKFWRMGFQDVVVNLTPPADTKKPDVKDTPEVDASWDDGLERNTAGDIVNTEGERVDVAFLLKRPLVRLKYFAKTFRGINLLKPSVQAETLAAKYQELVVRARLRSNEEKARLEDEAAASIDPTRARDPRSLAPLAGVAIDPSRCVRARDYFDLNHMHSSGQEIDCRVELLIRDDAPERGSSSDVLICEVDSTGRWLLFPPIQLGRISARQSDHVPMDIVVMIRGYSSGGQEWRELLSLRCSDVEASSEWVGMLGTTPPPPRLDRTRSFADQEHRPASSHASSLHSAAPSSVTPFKSRTPSPGEIEIPIGERANSKSKVWGVETPAGKREHHRSPVVSPITSASEDESGMQEESARSPVSPVSPTFPDVRKRPSKRHTISSAPTSSDFQTPRALREPVEDVVDSSPTTLRRTKAKRMSQGSPRGDRVPLDLSRKDLAHRTRSEPRAHERTGQRPYTPSDSEFSNSHGAWNPSSTSEDYDGEDDDTNVTPKASKHMRPEAHRRASSVPTLDLPTVNKLRKPKQPSTPSRHVVDHVERSTMDEEPSSAPAKLQKRRSERHTSEPIIPEDVPPPPPPHRSGSPIQPKSGPTVQFATSLPSYKGHRRTSSPLKHQYEPSTATESDDSEDSTSDEGSTDLSSSDESDEELDEVGSLYLGGFAKPGYDSPPTSTLGIPTSTLGPSQSASHLPYRTVPTQPEKASKTIASVFCWAQKGSWDTVHPDECSIVVTPGLIQAFEMCPAHSQPYPPGDGAHAGRPLIALELTPWVPLRRGTALDITIRSPPTSNSTLKPSGANFMFRSRSTTECETLYSFLNHARLNNPTFIALENARRPHPQSTWAAAMERRNNAREAKEAKEGPSLFSFKSGLSRRSKSYRAPSITGVTAANSVGTMHSTLSALKRFGGLRLAGLGRSTLAPSSRAAGSFDSSNSAQSATDALAPELLADAITATVKIRFYERHGQTRWIHMGKARLSILHPSRTPDPTQHTGRGPGDKASAGDAPRAGERRILVREKHTANTLLDVTLPELCFERINRTGIGINVWEDIVGPDGQVGHAGKVGGVGAVRCRTFMVQLPSEPEAAHAFNLLGKLRY